MMQFQSTHSRGVRHNYCQRGSRWRKISIHALTRSATQTWLTNYFGVGISIHALTRSATQIDKFRIFEYVFQSTHSRGVRRITQPVVYTNDLFQSTHSRGVRLYEFEIFNGLETFQSTHSRGVRHHRYL